MPSQFCTYRELGHSQQKQIRDWDEEFFPWPWKAEQWAFDLLVGMQDIACFAVFEYNAHNEQAHLYKLITHIGMRKKGHAESLLNFCHSELKKMRCKSIYLEVATSNEGAIALYQKLGYHKLVLKKSFYASGQDAWAMLLNLD